MELLDCETHLKKEKHTIHIIFVFFIVTVQFSLDCFQHNDTFSPETALKHALLIKFYYVDKKWTDLFIICSCQFIYLYMCCKTDLRIFFSKLNVSHYQTYFFLSDKHWVNKKSSFQVNMLFIHGTKAIQINLVICEYFINIMFFFNLNSRITSRIKKSIKMKLSDNSK